MNDFFIVGNSDESLLRVYREAVDCTIPFFLLLIMSFFLFLRVCALKILLNFCFLCLFFSSTTGNRISLISKKNIRYEGILYSINETNSTLALQNVTSFGTEGREKADPSTAFVAPQEGIHAYLLFRGCDIKDLHVHEQQPDAAAPQAVTTEAESNVKAPAPETPSPPQTTEKSTKTEDEKEKDLPPPPSVPETSATSATKKEYQSSGSSKKERPANNNNSQRRSNPRRTTAAVGTGASLLNRKARGAVQGGAC